ncbi:MAG: isoamylase early set domain-containing protein [Nitrospira sp.]|nr:isoamylase early set domain-containing protein [Nitrospira sp.]
MRFSRAIIVGVWVVLLAGIGGCAAHKAGSPDLPKPQIGTVRFMVEASGAKQVFVAGSFNGWRKDSISLNRVKGTSWWSVDLLLPKGEHAFMYVIDGVKWVTPPQADDFVEDEFGHRNGIVIVR